MTEPAVTPGDRRGARAAWVRGRFLLLRLSIPDKLQPIERFAATPFACAVRGDSSKRPYYSVERLVYGNISHRLGKMGRPWDRGTYNDINNPWRHGMDI